MPSIQGPPMSITRLPSGRSTCLNSGTNCSNHFTYCDRNEQLIVTHRLCGNAFYPGASDVNHKTALRKKHLLEQRDKLLKPLHVLRSERAAYSDTSTLRECLLSRGLRCQSQDCPPEEAPA